MTTCRWLARWAARASSSASDPGDSGAAVFFGMRVAVGGGGSSDVGKSSTPGNPEQAVRETAKINMIGKKNLKINMRHMQNQEEGKQEML